MSETAAPRLFEKLNQGVPFVIAGGLIFSMMAGADYLLYAVAAGGAVGSFMLGFLCVRRAGLPERDTTIAYGTSWLWVAGFAALSLLNGKWEPMVFFGGVGAVMATIFWIGARTAR